MRTKDIEIGLFYRLSSSPNYSYVKPLEILKPKQGVNTNNYIVVKCEHVVNKDDTTGFVRYLKLNELQRLAEQFNHLV